MAKKRSKTIASDNSWRVITQSGMEGVSPQAKKRRLFAFLKTFLVTISISSVFVLLIFCVYFCKRTSFSSMFFPVIKHIKIESDGPLSEAQLVPFINLPKNPSIMTVDIFQIRRRIESLGQVRNAIVERQLPDTIKISITEYQPIVKILASDENGKIQGLLISKEGHVFKGYGYNAKKLKHLPYLTGISLRRSGNSFKTVAHMDYLSELLMSAQLESPHLYKYWKSISLEYFQTGNPSFGTFIKVRTKNIGEIIFAPEKFGLQLGRLNSIVSYASKQKLATIERIDLSLGSQAAVKVATSP